MPILYSKIKLPTSGLDESPVSRVLNFTSDTQTPFFRVEVTPLDVCLQFNPKVAKTLIKKDQYVQTYLELGS